MKTTKFPHMTTIWPMNPKANTELTVQLIRHKIGLYGECSPLEKDFLIKHTRRKKPEQKQ